MNATTATIHRLDARSIPVCVLCRQQASCECDLTALCERVATRASRLAITERDGPRTWTPPTPPTPTETAPMNTATANHPHQTRVVRFDAHHLRRALLVSTKLAPLTAIVAWLYAIGGLS